MIHAVWPISWKSLWNSKIGGKNMPKTRTWGWSNNSVRCAARACSSPCQLRFLFCFLSFAWSDRFSFLPSPCLITCRQMGGHLLTHHTSCIVPGHGTSLLARENIPRRSTTAHRSAPSMATRSRPNGLSDLSPTKRRHTYFAPSPNSATGDADSPDWRSDDGSKGRT